MGETPEEALHARERAGKKKECPAAGLAAAGSAGGAVRLGLGAAKEDTMARVGNFFFF
jgi:hypothetical protein